MNVDYYHKDTKQKIKFQVSRTDQNYVSQLKSLQPVIDCLNKTINRNERMNILFNSLYATPITNRLGKSIYNTNLTEIYNQHNADTIAPDSISLDVPLEDGYVSHFRDYITGFFYNQEYPLNLFFVDLEFYGFLANLNQETDKP